MERSEMNDIFVSVEGSSKGREVELIKENGHDVVVKALDTNFIFFVSINDFKRCYRRRDDVKNRN